MGDCELSSIEEQKRKVESVSLTKIFEECCPIYMGYGMSYDDYWYGDPFKASFQRKTYEIQMKRKDEEFWMQGMYIYDAICRIAPILHAFSKSGTKPLPYPDKPYMAQMDKNISEEEKQKRIENERLIAKLHFEKWARAVAEKFENKNE